MKRFFHAAFLLTLLSVALAPPVLGQDATPAGPIYIVQSGDTLFKIAFEHNSTVEAFTELNNVNNPALIFVGQQLRIPVDDSLALPPVLPDFITPALHSDAGPPLAYSVAQGDTLSEIAAEYGLSLNALVDRNQITDASLLHVGQQIDIPGLEPQVIDAPWPEPVSLLQLGPGELLQGQSVRFVVQTTLPAQVHGSFLGSDLHFAADENGLSHFALSGIPLYTAPGFHDLGIIVDDGAAQTAFQWPLEVKAGVFGRQAVTLPPEALDTLDRDTENAEIALLHNAIIGNRSGRWFDGLLLRPSAGRVTSRFGTLRSYNQGPYDRIHNGVDFAAATGTPVQAAADGLVVLATELNVRGRSIILDHGLGVYTGYWHLSEMHVTVGDFVRAGADIAEVGNSGRSTGAHLHWQLWVNGIAVEPLQWLRSDFTRLQDSVAAQK